MRGAERPTNVKWSRPFLLPLAPLDFSAARQTFIDIADDVHEEDSVRELLKLTGNLPLAVSLIAGVAAAEGCEATLFRWGKESTHLLSDGYDQRSSLDISIMLSFSCDRMTPDAQQLLSILSMLPDGLSDAELTQSGLPIDNILLCKATLLRTALAYLDGHQRLRVLAPIREHVLATHPPSNVLKLALRQYFHNMLELWTEFKSLPSGGIVHRISVNLANVNGILLDALTTDDLANLYDILILDDFSRATNHNTSPLMERLLQKINSQPNNPLYGEYFIAIFASSFVRPIANPDAKLSLANAYFRDADDLEKGAFRVLVTHALKLTGSEAEWWNALASFYHFQGHDRLKSLHCYEKAVAIMENRGIVNKVLCRAVLGLANYMRFAGNHALAIAHSRRARELSAAVGDIFAEAVSLDLESACSRDLKHATNLRIRARELLKVCGLEGGATDMALRGGLAEIHAIKTEYAEARRLYAEMLPDSPKHPNPGTAYTHMNLALLDLEDSYGDPDLIRRNLDITKEQFGGSLGFPVGVLLCDVGYAALELVEGNTASARTMFQRCFTSLQHSEIQGALSCLDYMTDLGSDMYDVQATSEWATIYLASALNIKDQDAIMKALRALASISVVQGDDETGLTLYQVALDGFTCMDIHRWRADCMDHIGDILQRRGEISRAAELWKNAVPLFERSSRENDSRRMEEKLRLIEGTIPEYADTMCRNIISKSV